ncbi:MAG: DUF4091 domain-containing protein [Clostridia bacterium]|nr:DUF4091 domain-containing protein [Clostridia bacterium]
MCTFKLVSCLEKVFCDKLPQAEFYPPEGLLNEKAAFQAVWRADSAEFTRALVNLEIRSALAPYIKLYRVSDVPVGFPWIPCADDNYLRTDPGLFPDALIPTNGKNLRLFSFRYSAVWIEIDAPDSVQAGEYPITLALTDANGTVLAEASTVYKRIGARLPEQRLIHTRWFHSDGLCSYYGVKMFDEEFWRICENFMRAAADMSVNCLLTPVHTPPLDTAVGGERLTCQLTDIVKSGDEYAFGFEKLERWIRLAQKCGIRYFEIVHFFTQWGARHAPKIIAVENGCEKQLFGWDTDALSDEYTSFLKQYITALRQELTRLGVLENCLFHISDEPGNDHLEYYSAARASVKKELEGLTVIDALSSIELYNAGAVEHPVPATNHIKPFLDAKIPGLWAYYCTGQFEKVSNAFISMPLARERIIGLQMYKYDISGFLHWGFNFYNSQYSLFSINPWRTTDGDGFSPSGDCFIVYPGENGEAYPSLRSKVFEMAVNDLRACRLLEEKCGRDTVMSVIEKDIPPLEFDEYPKEAEYLFDVRRRINALL